MDGRFFVKKTINARSNETGSALVEFVLCIGLFWMPLFVGTFFGGLNLIRVIQVTQVCRDAAHMSAYGIDFSQASSQNLLVSLQPSLGLTTSTSSHGVVILSVISHIVQATDCTPAGISNCANDGYDVVERRIIIGNTSLPNTTSSFGTPCGSCYVDTTSGNITAAAYLNDTSTRAAANGVSFAPPIVLSSGHFAYVAETFVTSPEHNGWIGIGTPSIAARFIF
jgi:hypothetical protein